MNNANRKLIHSIFLIILTLIFTCTKCFAIDIKTITEGTYKGRMRYYSPAHKRSVYFNLILIVANKHITGLVYGKNPFKKNPTLILLPEDNNFFVKYMDSMLKLTPVDRAYDGFFTGVARQLNNDISVISNFKGFYSGDDAFINIGPDGLGIIASIFGIFFGKFDTDGKFIKKIGSPIDFSAEPKSNNTYIINFKENEEAKSIELHKVE